MARSIRDRFAGRAQVVFDADEPEDGEEDEGPKPFIPWSLDTYPEPDMERFAKRKGVEYLTATQRMYWRSDRTLMCRAGVEYRADLADQLMTEEELLS